MDSTNQSNTNNGQNMSLNRNSDNNQAQQPQQQPQQQYVPYAAFPANQKRDYDPNIYNMIAELVDRKYPDIHPEARLFEIAKTYNHVEIDVFELSTYQLPPDKQKELQQMTENSQANGTANQQESILKIREYMQNNVPNISEMVNQYMIGFRNQYMAGRF